MKRMVLATVVTIAGLAALLGFKSKPVTTTGISALGTSPGTTGNAPAAGHRRSAGTGSADHRLRTVTGGVAQTPYGPVQVRVSERSGHITDVSAVRLPSGNPNSVQIAQYATPILRQEAIRRDSAHIDVVSGATYTSEGYAQSLQSALDAARS